MLNLFRRENPAETAAQALYGVIVARSRAAVFHIRFGVADTIDGRFDLLVLHLYLVLMRLRDEGAAGSKIAGALTTLAFNAFEEALRELGVSDTGMSRRIKAMANAYYGRLDAYLAAGDNEAELAAALLRNLYRGDQAQADSAISMARYAIGARKNLQGQAGGQGILQGNIDFGPLPPT